MIMIEKAKITKKNKQMILEVLYQDEPLNLFLIHYIENRIEDLGDLLICEFENQIKAVLHIKNDGNSNFTNFYAYSNLELRLIGQYLRKIQKPKLLLAGKPKDIYQILDEFEIEKKLELNNYYLLNRSIFDKIEINHNLKLLKAKNNERDKNLIKKYMINFFELKTKEDIEILTNDKIIIENINNGIYFLINEDRNIVGMARFFGYSKNYVDITTVYVEKKYRGQGYGKELMKLMVKEGLDMGKVPVTQTSINNQVAISIYEGIGFEKISDYAFEFI